MKVIVISLFYFIGFYFLPGQASSQSLVGQWKNQQFNMTFNLNSNGTYTFQSPWGNSTGTYGTTYGANGQVVLWTKDSKSGAVTMYAIGSLTANSLLLIDQNGNSLSFTKQSGNQNTKPVMQMSGSGKVIATKDGYSLTEDDYLAWVYILEFIIGEKLRKSDKKLLRKELIKQFKSNPSGTKKETNDIANAIKTLRTVKDIQKIGLARQMIYSALYKATINLPKHQKPVIIKIIDKYIKVLAFDPQNNLILTDKDVNSLLNYFEFIYKLYGVKFKFTKAQRKQYQKTVAKQFNQMPLQQKQLLCSAGLLWFVVKTSWDKLTPSQKQQYIASVKAQAGNMGYNNGYNAGSGSYASKASPKSGKAMNTKQFLRKMQQDMFFSQNMFNMMNNMMLQQHATSLNIIENIGNTGVQWEVK